tara:strand:+ start:5749 stop:6300 length:552 start_codon:yes stop_codon:yes gene_type:complete
MKKIFFLPILFFSLQSQSQTYVKINALTTILTVPNIAVETSLGKKTSLQIDILALPWKSMNGVPRQFYTLTTEFRYHFKEQNKGFYVGAHVGGSKYNFQKWNYLNTDKYEIGKGYFIGATMGYKAKINDKFSLDCFLGGGWHQGFYKGYRLSDGTRYETAPHYNKSGEWLPYRGGVMISYKLN